MLGRRGPTWALTITLLGIAAPESLARSRLAPNALLSLPVAQTKLEKAVEAYRYAQVRLRIELAAADSDEERAKVAAAADWSTHIEAFRNVAYESGGEEESIEAWVWVVRAAKLDQPDDAREAVGNLLAGHIDSPGLTGLLSELAFPDGVGVRFARETMAKIAADSSDEAVQTAARFALAGSLLGSGHATEEERAAARKLYAELRTSEKDDGLAQHRIERALYELDHLQIGMPAPDFEATDVDGASFKLSDYRGKVVVLDFWGFW